MRNVIKVALLLTVSAAAASAGQVLVDFSIFGVPSMDSPSLLGPQNITTTPFVTRSITTSGVGFQYEIGPAALTLVPTNLGECGFDAGNGGIQWQPGCVGAHVDSGGVYGTTDGTYNLSFAGAYALAFNFQVFTVGNPDTMSQDFGLSGLFFLNGVLNGTMGMDSSSAGVGCAGAVCFGQFDYSGPAFNLALLNFSPAGQLTYDANGVPIAGSHGLSTLSMDTVSFDPTPEPATMALCAGALLGLGALRKLLRKRS